MVRSVEASMRGYARKIGLDDVSPRSVRRKMKDKAFAKDVNRVDIQKGAVELGGRPRRAYSFRRGEHETGHWPYKILKKTPKSGAGQVSIAPSAMYLVLGMIRRVRLRPFFGRPEGFELHFKTGISSLR